MGIANIRELSLEEAIEVKGGDCVGPDGKSYGNGYVYTNYNIPGAPSGSYYTMTCSNNQWTDFSFHF